MSNTESWEIRGIRLSLPKAMVTPTIRRMGERGWYEFAERKALEAHLQPGDRVLEIGGGAGYLACVSAARGASVVTVEANPAMVPVIEANLAANGAEVTVLSGAALPGSAPEGSTIILRIPEAFWGATTALSKAEGIVVPRLSVEALLAEHAPDILIVDVEGAEAGFFDHPLPSPLRAIVLELHPDAYPAATIPAIFARLAERGFGYSCTGSQGAVVVFERLPDGPGAGTSG